MPHAGSDLQASEPPDMERRATARARTDVVTFPPNRLIATRPTLSDSLPKFRVLREGTYAFGRRSASREQTAPETDT